MGVAIKLSDADFSTKKIKTVTFADFRIVQSISAVFTQGSHTFYSNSSLDSLKEYLVVTALYDDETSAPVTDYTLSGTLEDNTSSTITVTYAGKTTTFNVTVAHIPVLESLNAVYTQGSKVIYPSEPINNLKADLVVTAIYDVSQSTLASSDYNLSGNLTVGSSTITVEYNGITTTFTVNVTKQPVLDHLVATYGPMGTVYPSTPLSVVKGYITVSAVYDDESSYQVAQNDFTISGTLTAGTSTITVSYSTKTTTVDITVAPERTATSIVAVLTLGDHVVYTTDNLNTLKSYLVVTVNYDDESTTTADASEYTLSGTLTEGSTSEITVTYNPNTALTTTFTVPNVEVNQFEPETTVYCTAAGITASAKIDAVDAFIKGLKTNNLWNRCVAIYPFMGTTLAQMQVDLKNTYPLTEKTGSNMNTVVAGESVTKPFFKCTDTKNVYTQSYVDSNGCGITVQFASNTFTGALGYCVYAGSGNGMSNGIMSYIYESSSSTANIYGRANDNGITTATGVLIDKTVETPSVFTLSYEKGIPVDIYKDGAKPTYTTTSPNAVMKITTPVDFEISNNYGYLETIRFLILSDKLTLAESTILHSLIHTLKDNALPLPAIESLTANFNQGTAKIYPSTELDDLKQYLTVVAHYDDNSTYTLLPEEMALTGILQEGTSTITVTFDGVTANFNVTVSPTPTVSSLTATFTQGDATIYSNTSFTYIKSKLQVVAHMSDETDITLNSNQYEITGTLAVGTSTLTVSYGGQTTTFDVTVSSGSAMDQDVATFITAAGITDADTISKLTAFVQTVKDEGIWDKCEVIYPFCAENEAGMLIDLKHTANLTLSSNSSANGNITSGTSVGEPYKAMISKKAYRFNGGYEHPFTLAQIQANGYSNVIALNPSKFAETTGNSDYVWQINKADSSFNTVSAYGTDGKEDICFIIDVGTNNTICVRRNSNGYNATNFDLGTTDTIKVIGTNFVDGSPVTMFVDGQPITPSATSGNVVMSGDNRYYGFGLTSNSYNAGTYMYFFTRALKLTDAEQLILANAIAALKA